MSFWDLITHPVYNEAVLHASGRHQISLSGAELIRRAEYSAQGLLAKLENAVPPRIGILMENGEPWMRSFLTSVRLGAAAVPLATPMALGSFDAFARNLKKIADDASLQVILVDDSLEPELIERLGAVLPGTRFIDISDETDTRLADLPALSADDDDPVIIQYTSGSTSSPKGVVVTHNNLAAGLDAISQSIDWNSADRLGHWLPLHHDMGLIMTLCALRMGNPVHIWRPLDFVRRPLDWLVEFGATGSTILPAPNFFYDYLVVVAKRGLPDQLDLAAWRYGGNASEPVRLESIEAFYQTFKDHGLRPQVVQPAYGLAEATLVVSCGRPGAQYRSLLVKRTSLVPGMKMEQVLEESEATRRVASCGSPVDGLDVRIGDTDGQPVPPGIVGEVLIAGNPVTPGYLGLAAHLQPATATGMVKTGDLGFVYDNELYIVGRLKAMVIVRGQNYYAEDIEEVVRHTRGVDRPQCCAFAAVTDEAEKVVVVWETKLQAAAADKVSRDIRQRLGTHLGVDRVEVVPVTASSLPFTSSGKIKRYEVAESHANGALQHLE